MSETLQIDSDRLKEIIEYTIMKDRSNRPIKAPRIVLHNCNVSIENGNTFERDNDQQEQNTQYEPDTAPTKEEPKREQFQVRPGVFKLMVDLEKALKQYESKPHEVLDTQGHSDNIVKQCVLLDQKRKGDTSVESIRIAYVNAIGAIYLAAEAGGVFQDG